jgi:hypothetical protein
MESRKRLGSDPAVASSSRPAKRVATDPEHIPIQTDPFAYEDLSFINDFRREAIYRTLVAERRETQRLREKLKTCEVQSASHDDHIRLIDLWLKQVLEELAVTYRQYDPAREGMSPLCHGIIFDLTLACKSLQLHATLCPPIRIRSLPDST